MGAVWGCVLQIMRRAFRVSVQGDPWWGERKRNGKEEEKEDGDEDVGEE